MKKRIFRFSDFQIFSLIIFNLTIFNLRGAIMTGPNAGLQQSNLGTASVTNYQLLSVDGSVALGDTDYVYYGFGDLFGHADGNGAFEVYQFTNYWRGVNSLAAITPFSQSQSNILRFFSPTAATNQWATWGIWIVNQDIALTQLISYSTNNSVTGSYTCISNYLVSGAGNAEVNGYYFLNGNTNANLSGYTNEYDEAMGVAYLITSPNHSLFSQPTNYWLLVENAALVYYSTNSGLTWLTNGAGTLPAPTVVQGNPTPPTITSNLLHTNYTGILNAGYGNFGDIGSQDGLHNVSSGTNNNFASAGYQNGKINYASDQHPALVYTNSNYNWSFGSNNVEHGNFNMTVGFDNTNSDNNIPNYFGMFQMFNITAGHGNISYGDFNVGSGEDCELASGPGILWGGLQLHIRDGVNVISGIRIQTYPYQVCHHMLVTGNDMALTNNQIRAQGEFLSSCGGSDVIGLVCTNVLPAATQDGRSGYQRTRGRYLVNQAYCADLTGWSYTNAADRSDDFSTLKYDSLNSILYRALYATNSPTNPTNGLMDGYIPIASGKLFKLVSPATAVGSSFVASSSGNGTNTTLVTPTFNGLANLRMNGLVITNGQTNLNLTASRMLVSDAGSGITNSGTANNWAAVNTNAIDASSVSSGTLAAARIPGTHALATNTASFTITTNTAATFTNAAQRALTLCTIKFITAATGTAAVKFNCGDYSLIETPINGVLAGTITNIYTLPMQPSAVMTITDASTGSGASISVITNIVFAQ